MPTLLLGAAGLSQKDVALSRRAEEQLEQERRDAELAARLQEEDEEAGKSTIKNVVSMQRKYFVTAFRREKQLTKEHCSFSLFL